MSTASAPSTNGKLIAKVENLKLHFDTKRGVVKALDGVDFEIREGEILSLVGETGCGKTITARSFMQLVPTPPGRYPEGRILFRSQETCDACSGNGCEECFETGQAFENLLAKSQKEMQKLRGDRISMVFQDPQTALNPSLTVREQVAEAILSHQGEDILQKAGVDTQAIGQPIAMLLRAQASADRSLLDKLLGQVPPLRTRAKAIRRTVREESIAILRDTQIPNPREVIDKYPHELSGGMQQRVMIAMGLVSKPDLLIADEATTALDVTTQARILDLLSDLQEDYNTSVLYITHDLTLVNQIADRVAVMYAGSIAEIGSVEQVYADPLHPYTNGLLESIPTEETVGRQLSGIGGTIPDLTNPPKGCRFCTRCPEELEHCATVKPELHDELPGHGVACHLYESHEDWASTPNESRKAVQESGQ